MRTVDVYDDNYVTNATNVKDALETYGNAWFSSVVLDTTGETDHAHVKCYVQSQVDPVIDMDITNSGTLVYHIGSYTISSNYSPKRIYNILFTDNGIVLKRGGGSDSSDNDTFIIGKDVAGNLCGYYVSTGQSSRYTTSPDTSISGSPLYPVMIKLTSPVYTWQITANVKWNNDNNPYVIAYPFASRYGVSDKIWRIKDSFYYTAKREPFMISMNNKTYLTLAYGSMIIETT